MTFFYDNSIPIPNLWVREIEIEAFGWRFHWLRVHDFIFGPLTRMRLLVRS